MKQFKIALQLLSCVFLFTVFFVLNICGQEALTAKCYLTAKDSEDRLTQKEELTFEAFPQPDEMFPTIMIDPDKKFQVIEGFGGAFTDAAAETFYKLSDGKQKELLDAYFTRDKGIGYSLCRTHINSCDFSSESYAYADMPGDTLLEHFSIDHDRKFRIPMIKAALATAGTDIKIFASPWSPPRMDENQQPYVAGRQGKT